MIQSAAVFSHTASQQQGSNAGAIDQVVVIPVIDPRADDDHALAFGLDRSRRPLTRKLNHRLAVNAGVAFLPGGSVRKILVIVVGGIITFESTPHTVLRHEQVVHSGNRHFAFSRFHITHRHTALEGFAFAKLSERNRQPFIGCIKEAQLGTDLASIQTIFRFQIPLSLLLLPAEAQTALRHTRLIAKFIPNQKFPLAVFHIASSFHLSST